MGAKLKNSNFDGATFNNVLFVTQKITDCKNLLITDSSPTMVKTIKPLILNERLTSIIDAYCEQSKDKITHILKLNSTKYNFLHIGILLETCSEEQIIRGLSKLLETSNFDFPTIYSLKNYLQKTVYTVFYTTHYFPFGNVEMSFNETDGYNVEKALSRLS